MKENRSLSATILVASMLLPGCGGGEISFRTDVQAIFDEHCIGCHDGGGEGLVASGFSVHDYDSVMKGTSLGKVVIPGSSISSTLYLVVAQKTAPEIQMPPHHKEAWAEGRRPPLPDSDVATIAAWIDQGARNN